jgi:hypothetical protein
MPEAGRGRPEADRVCVYIDSWEEVALTSSLLVGRVERLSSNETLSDW